MKRNNEYVPQANETTIAQKCSVGNEEVRWTSGEKMLIKFRCIFARLSLWRCCV